jgi:4'-phosphopantetheinyl transferase
MPIAIQQTFDNTLLIAWHLTETYNELLEQSECDGFDNERLAEISNESKRREWLAVRIMLTNALGFWPRIRHLETGKPYLLNSPMHISISHTKEMTCALLSSSETLGIDVEHSNRNIDGILKRFLNRTEQQKAMQASIEKEKMVYWCAKEAIFKAVNETGIDFSKQIEIVSIQPMAPFGKIAATYTSSQGTTIPFILNFTEISNHTLVWTRSREVQ